jgi:hypothetical protein
MRLFRILVSSTMLAICLTATARAQEIRIDLGQGQIGINQPFTITIIVENGNLKSYGTFPEIRGLYKRGTSSSSSTNIINGKITSSQSITQNYFAETQGVFSLEPFTMKVNDQDITSPGITIRVGAPVQQRNPFDPFDANPLEDLLGDQQRPQEFLDIKEDAFLALTTDKDLVYVGEGFTLILAFYIAENNKAPMQFYDPARQLGEILKKIKPANCWEENFNIENIAPERVTVNGQPYSRYKIYEAAYYPLNADTIRFPSVPFKMIKYKVARNPSFFGRNRLEDYKTFYTKPKAVIVRQLPPFPSRDAVAIGNYRLTEKIESTTLATGQSFNYEFTIQGEGNIAAINEPSTGTGNIFEIYPPNVRQNINRSGDKVSGTKSFSYYMIPNEPGTFNLGNYFTWIFFNTGKKQYDTLRSELIVTVTGESKKNEQISANDVGSFYDQIEIESNELANLRGHQWVRYAVNLFVIIMLGVSIYIIFKK